MEGLGLDRLKWWHVLVALLFLPFTILFLLFVMWRREMFSRNARIALSIVGVFLALGIISNGLASASKTPDESSDRTAVETVQETPASSAEVATEPAAETETESAFSLVTVSRVIDGDTIEVTYDDGKVEKVRLIGVDCPESTTQVEAYGKEASAFTDRELSGKQVYLETDAELRDKYGRLLAYVWLTEPPSDASETEIRESLFNSKLLIAGFAQLLTIPPNVKYVDAYKALQTEAQSNEVGLWTPEPEPEPRAAAKPAPEPEPEPEPQASSGGAVYITRTGEKYHLGWCSSLSKSKIEVSRADAEARGYAPCSRCNP